MNRLLKTLTLADASRVAFDLLVAHAVDPSWTVLILPGAQIRAERYLWIAEGLADATVAILDPPEVMRTTPFSPDRPVPTRFASLGQLIAAHAALAGLAQPARRAIIGHSHGGAVLLEALDGAEARRNPMSAAPQGFAGLSGVDVAITLGAHLQAEAMSFTIPWRDSSRPLRAVGARLALVSAEHDRMATPYIVAATAARYGGAARYHSVAGANHLRWATGTGPFDRPDLDGAATIAPVEQQTRTLDIIRAALETA